MKIQKICVAFLIVLLLTVSQAWAFCFARWYTSMGEFTAEIRDDLMPITGTNFINLTNSNFYDNLIFHRVIDGFVIQDGCPLGTGYGGPGYTIEDEYSPYLLHDSAGMLAMAKTNQPNSAGSQYYITLAPQPHLDGNYAVFGKVIEGLDVVLGIGQVPTDSNNKPVTDVVIDSLRILSLEINSIYPEESEITIDDGDDILFTVDAFDLAELQVPEFNWFFNGELQEEYYMGFFSPQFGEPGEYTVGCLVITEDIVYPVNWTVNFIGTSVDPETHYPGCLRIISSYPNPFTNTSVIRFQLPKREEFVLNVYDVRGRSVDIGTVLDLGGDSYEWKWENTGKANGIYFFEIKTRSDRQVVRKLILR